MTSYFIPRNWGLDTSTAARKAKKCRQTLWNWCSYSKYRVGDKGIGILINKNWRIDSGKLDLILEDKRNELINLLLKELIEDFKEISKSISIQFRIKSDKKFLNLFKKEIGYFGRNRNDLKTVEVPFLVIVDDDGKDIKSIPIPLLKRELIEFLPRLGFRKINGSYLLEE